MRAPGRAAAAGLARSVPLLTWADLRWIIGKRAYTPGYLVRYLRLLALRLRHLGDPGLVVQGVVYLGRGVEIEIRRGHGRLIVGPWVHLGAGTALRVHEGTMRIGPKVVTGERVVIDCHLDIEIGAGTLIADGVHVVDFDHRFGDTTRPIKDQGIVTAPVRIGPGCWLGSKATVVKGTRIGSGTVVGAHAVVRGAIPDHVVVAGVPARIVRRIDPLQPPPDGGAAEQTAG